VVALLEFIDVTETGGPLALSPVDTALQYILSGCEADE
jgi:hypothetical protein